MKYKFDEEGISMSWGILFRHEIILNYARIQDIHLRSNILERWLGLARILIQTAGGSSSAEMTLEGLKQFESVRDFLYSRMRGVHATTRSGPDALTGSVSPGVQSFPELAGILREVASELRAIRTELATRHNETNSGRSTRNV
jgi:putative membrane protein